MNLLLEGNLVYIRTLQRSDLPITVTWKNDPELADLIKGTTILTNLSIESRRFEKIVEIGDSLRLLITCKDGTPIGLMALSEVDKTNQKASLGMFIGNKAYWNKGYGSDALKTLLKHCFGHLKFNRIGLEVFDYNVRAIKMYSKIGFKIEGTQRQGLWRNNQYHDIYLMGILKEEFAE